MAAGRKSKITTLAGVLGLSLLATGCFFAFLRTRDLSQADASVALANVAEIDLKRIGSADPLALSLIIPDTPQWVRIRKKWGVPDFLIAAISAGRRSCYCLTELPLSITVVRGEDRIPLQPSSPPYGYSSECPMGAGKINAAPGTRVTVSVAKRTSEPLPAGKLIIVNNWPDVKDKLVGIALDQELRRVSNVAVVCGSALILVAAIRWYLKPPC